MDSPPLWRDFLPVAYLLLGALLGWLAATSSWRRDVAHLALIDTHKLSQLMWQPGSPHNERLSNHLSQLGARLKALGIDDTFDDLRASVVRFHDYVEWGVDVNSLGEPYAIPVAPKAPDGYLEEAAQAIHNTERVLLHLMKPLGHVRVAWRHWIRSRERPRARPSPEHLKTSWPSA